MSEELVCMPVRTRVWTEEMRQKMRDIKSNVSLETRIRMSNAHKGKTTWNKGISPSIETRRRSSKSKMGKPAHNKGVSMSLETRKKMSKTHKRLGTKPPSPIEHPNSVRHDTSIELKVEAELKARKINYQKQVPLCKIAIVDFYLPEYHIVIQADGCYWHNCPDCNLKKIKGATERGKMQDSVLALNGFTVYRFWEHEIKVNVCACIDRVIF